MSCGQESAPGFHGRPGVVCDGCGDSLLTAELALACGFLLSVPSAIRDPSGLERNGWIDLCRKCRTLEAETWTVAA